jgi:hypothetical protein
MDVLANAEPLISEVHAEFPDIVVCDLQHSQKLNSVNSIRGKKLYCTSGLEPVELIRQLLSSNAEVILQRNEAYFVEDLRISARILADPNSYFQRRAPGLIPQATETMALVFSGPNQKSVAKEQCLDFVKDEVSNVQESMDCLFEEFYMNAMFDAPSEAKKQGKAYDLYERGQSAILSLAKDSQRIAISCFDPYGSLNITKFLKRLEEVLTHGAGAVINMADQGAGIGCSIILEHALSVYIGVIPGQCSLVSVVVPRGMSLRQRSKMQKSIHLVQGS